MTRKRFDSSPQFNVKTEGVLIQQVAGSSTNLLEVKDSSGNNLMAVDSSGVMSASLAPAIALPAGMLAPYAGSTAPTGWLLCAGQAVSRTTYASLFAAISTTYGSGDGSTTFNLPDLRGRTIAGVDNMGGSAASRITSGNSGITGTTLGAAGGDERYHQHSHANTASFTGSAVNTGTQSVDHTHSVTSNVTLSDPGHSHTIQSRPDDATSTGSWYVDAENTTQGIQNTYTMSATTGITVTNNAVTSGGMSQSHTHSVTAAGTIAMTNANAGSGASQNVQPTILLNYIIKH